MSRQNRTTCITLGLVLSPADTPPKVNRSSNPVSFPTHSSDTPPACLLTYFCRCVRKQPATTHTASAILRGLKWETSTHIHLHVGQSFNLLAVDFSVFIVPTVRWKIPRFAKRQSLRRNAHEVVAASTGA